MRELLLIDIGGLSYGVWGDEVHGIEDLRALHRLPLMPACIAGMSIIDDRTMMLADLSVCVGHEPMRRQGTGSILLLSGAGKVTGFVIDHKPAHIQVPADAVYAMPEYLGTRVIDTCVLHGERLVPVINLSTLYERVQTSDRGPLVAGFFSTAKTEETTETEAFRIIGLGDELFAVNNAIVEKEPLLPGCVSKLHLTPQFVQGTVLRNGAVLPVIDLLQRIRMRRAAPDARMLAARINGADFALLVDADHGSLRRDTVAVKALPPLARSRWLRNALMPGRDVLPLIDLQELLTAPPDEVSEGPLSQSYAPESDLAAHFGNEDLDVVEFSLLGVRHALPKAEVLDVIGFKPCRALPGLLPVVIGVVEHEGDLLPALDLAMVFEKRSLARSDWRMVLVGNGDFRALVITEAVYGERWVPRGQLRLVPIQLPHRVVYGCYPEGDAVRLVLNVHALAVYFEKTMARELLPALGIQPAVPGEPVKYQDAGEPEAALPSGEVETYEVIQDAPVAACAPAPLAKTEEQQPEPGPFLGGVLRETPVSVKPEEEKTIEPPAQEYFVPQVIEGQPARVGERSDEKPAEPAPVQEPLSHEQKPPPPGPGDARFDQNGLASAQDRTTDEHPQGEQAEDDAAEAGQTPLTGPADAEEEPGMSGATQPVELHEVNEPVRLDTERSYAPIPAPADPPIPASPYEKAAYPEEKDHDESPAGPEDAAQNRKAPRIISAAIVLVVFMLLYFARGLENTGPVKKEAVAPKRAVVEAPAQVQSRPRGPLVIEIPANSPNDFNVYAVKRGDTLWGISKRFTGDPFNYPRLAGENGIADPDLIFPDQKIRMIRK